MHFNLFIRRFLLNDINVFLTGMRWHRLIFSLSFSLILRNRLVFWDNHERTYLSQYHLEHFRLSVYFGWTQTSFEVGVRNVREVSKDEKRGAFSLTEDSALQQKFVRCSSSKYGDAMFFPFRRLLRFASFARYIRTYESECSC